MDLYYSSWSALKSKAQPKTRENQALSCLVVSLRRHEQPSGNDVAMEFFSIEHIYDTNGEQVSSALIYHLDGGAYRSNHGMRRNV